MALGNMNELSKAIAEVAELHRTARAKAMNPMETLTLTNEVICELTSLAYRKWAECSDNVKKVKEEKDDKSEHWFIIHGEKLRLAVSAEIKARYVLDSIRKYCHV